MPGVPQVLEAESGNLKALYRRAQAYLASGDFVEAEMDIKQGLMLVGLCFFCPLRSGLLRLQWLPLHRCSCRSSALVLDLFSHAHPCCSSEQWLLLGLDFCVRFKVASFMRVPRWPDIGTGCCTRRASAVTFSAQAINPRKSASLPSCAAGRLLLRLQAAAEEVQGAAGQRCEEGGRPLQQHV